MPYYGDYYAGDPGLFSFVKKIKLGRVIGGLVKAVPGASGILTAVNAIRSAAGAVVAPRPVTPAAAPVVQVPAPLPMTAAQAAPAIGATRTITAPRRRRKRRVISSFATRMAAARRRRLRSRGYRV